MIATLDELDRVRTACRRLVTKRALMAAGATAVPIPGADMVADIGLLTTLLPDISKRFELDHESIERLDPHLAARVLLIASSLGNNLIGRAVTKHVIGALLRRVGKRVAAATASRFVPVIGSAIAGGISFGAMKLVGNAHVEDCYRTAREMLREPPTVGEPIK